MKILYPIINGEVTGGNIICLRIIEESLRRNYQVVVNSPTEGKFTHLLREKSIRVYDIDTRRTFRLDSAIKLARIIKKEGINLVHSHTPLAGTILSRLAGWIAGVPVINHTHASYSINLNSNLKWYHFLLNWITSRLFCVKVITVSDFVKREIIKQGVAVNKIIVIHNGIDLGDAKYKSTPINIREEFGLKQNQHIVGQVGRLGEDKGQYIFIMAARKVNIKYPDTVFMIVGEDLGRGGDYRKALERLAVDLGLKEQVIFTGYRPDITDLMNAFDIFVLPSLFMEGLPIVVLEAMAAKKPVIATDGGGIPEVVINGETGTLIPPEDPDKLAEAIMYYLRNPELSKERGEKGYKIVNQYFALSEMLEKVLSLYDSVVNFN